ncbi:MAG TPA: hypothetical protein EYO33_29965 [Phycisphaerales bacterium]|nr:hypothetical protein [Phycisphaerales bacterium]
MSVLHRIKLGHRGPAANDLDQLEAQDTVRQGLEGCLQKMDCMDEIETVSSLRQAKVRHLFNIYDADGNGVLEKFDFQSIADNFARARGLESEADSYRRLRDGSLKVWSRLQQHADKNGDGKITLEEMLSYHNLITHDPALFQEQVVSLTEGIFQVLDSDSDGVITRGEYFEFASCLGFQALPEDYELITQGQEFTRELFQERLSEFFLSQRADSPGNRLFGKVPK